MRFVVYARLKDPAARQLQNIIEQTVSTDTCDFCDSMESFYSRLFAPCNKRPVAIALPYDAEDWEVLQKIADVSNGVKIILALSDNKPETLRKAHKLRPRFIAHTTGDLSDLASVLLHIAAKKSVSS